MATTASNTLLTPDMITAKSLAVLHQKLNVVGSVNREYDSSFAQSGAKIGDTLRIRLPNQYVVRTDMTLAPQATVEQNASLTVSNVSGVDISFSTTDLTLKIDEFSTRYIEPAVAVIAANIESRFLANALKVYNMTSVTGAQTFANVLRARKILLDNLTPQSKQWQLRINTQDNVDMVSELKGLFQQSTAIASQYTDGVMGIAGGFNWAENTHLSTFTRSAAVDYAVNNTVVTGTATLDVKTGTGTAVAGEVFTVAGVYRLHPETKVSTGVLQQFVLTATAGGAGTQTWAISPTPVFTASVRGPRDNVSKMPTANDLITFQGVASATTGMSLAYHPDFATFATADLVMPGGVDMASRAQKDGISIRLIRQYDINTDYLPCRLDVLWGSAVLRPQLACRVVAN
jgi:hypothetical protein